MNETEFRGHLKRLKDLGSQWRRQISLSPDGRVREWETSLASFVDNIGSMLAGKKDLTDQHRATIAASINEISTQINAYLVDCNVQLDALTGVVRQQSQQINKIDGDYPKLTDPIEGTTFLEKARNFVLADLELAARAEPPAEQRAPTGDLAKFEYLGAKADTLWGWYPIRDAVRAFAEGGDPLRLSTPALTAVHGALKSISTHLKIYTDGPSIKNAENLVRQIDAVKSVCVQHAIYPVDSSQSLLNEANTNLSLIKAAKKEAEDEKALARTTREEMERLRADVRDAVLAGEFQKQADELEGDVRRWGNLTWGTLAAILCTGIYAFFRADASNPLALLKLLPIEGALALTMWWCSRNYSYYSNLLREYRFKAVVSSTLSAFRKEMDSTENAEAQKYLTEASLGVFSTPTAAMGKPPIEEAVKVAARLLPSPK